MGTFALFKTLALAFLSFTSGLRSAECVKYGNWKLVPTWACRLHGQSARWHGGQEEAVSSEQ
ncbi:hypothetical protein CLAFUW4_20020 [Fulvia fulva]|uniref:uncharacterized protein n=1 Tax=Passalora fulva TaxID=5499 RepID=UPI0028529776|nr:uncharacterized protein CLAFUR5_20020 [Fulvia fulva]KAK4630870.1 hypothetical protein CLAFUR4_20020 [Fulvia fulva]KAK4633013.1 hypothetical protein CLAFUR0_20020 [Fulvia fulva]WMI38809.1 hypothetical protein CLAFUR5_20020 [Fulvia fulva]WPV10786.1 hypothetical protein CLAFUW4_20020 [Fulvia fulva]WPV26773.1 hypothetical protein CLAFUW7_20020 [Fulvia fulva]